MKPHDIYSSTSLAASVRFNYCHFLLRCGPDGLTADSPFQLHSINLRKPLCRVLATVKDFGSVVEAEIGFKVKITGLAYFKE